jgi:ubiquinone/menaquinone biosynthesis C-methylase UbiE
MTVAPHAGVAGDSIEEASVPHFDRLAYLYRWMEYATFGPWLWRCRCIFLPEMGECRRALVLGDGDGRFTARLLAENSAIQVDAIDASASMLRVLAARAGAQGHRVTVHCADARYWQTNSLACDLIVTHFFLDCLTTAEVRDLAKKLRGMLAPSGLWVVSEFAVPKNWFGRVVARPIVSTLYAAFGLLTGLKVRTLPNYPAALREAGFVLKKRRTWLSGLLVSELWSLS